MTENEKPGIEFTEFTPEMLQELSRSLQHITKRLRYYAFLFRDKIEVAFARAARQIKKSLKEAFTVSSLWEAAQREPVFGQELGEALYRLQKDFDGLRLAAIRAAAPFASLFVPVVRQAVQALSSLGMTIHSVFSRLFGTGERLGSLSQGLSGTAAAAKALRRSLAGFDQLNRLNGKTGWGGAQVDPLAVAAPWQALADKLLSLLKPLTEIDLSPLHTALDKLRSALEPLTKALFSGLEWGWKHIFLPLAQWTSEELLPKFLEALTAALGSLERLITQLKPAFTWLWESCLQPLAQWAGGQVIGYLQKFTDYLNGVGAWVEEHQHPVDAFIDSMGLAENKLGLLNHRMSLYTQAGSAMTAVTSAFGSAAQALGGPLSSTATAVDGVRGVMQTLADQMTGAEGVSGSLWSALQSDWGGAWSWFDSNLMDPMSKGVRGTLNDIIRFINGVIEAAGKAVNTVIDLLNSLNYDIPAWVPVFGGKKFGFELTPVTVPQIPYLAQGAVLPANKPFMAVVGDQRHGTNIEAPLATIEAAVGNVLSARLQGVEAGFRAVTSRQEQLLSALLSLDLSEAALAGAVDRHHRKMLVVTGGQL